jgi:hypothetical protein
LGKDRTERSQISIALRPSTAVFGLESVRRIFYNEPQRWEIV